MRYLILFILTISFFPVICFADASKEIPNENTSLQNSQDAASPTEILAKIKELRGKSDYQQAETVAIEHLKKYPKDVDVEYLLGLTYLDEKKYEDAYKTLSDVVKNYPKYVDARISLINTCMKLEKTSKDYHAEALKLVEEGLAIDSGNTELNSLKKKLQSDDNQTSQVLSTKNNKIEKQNKVISTAKSENVKDASDYKKQPNDTDGMLSLGFIYLENGNYKEAENYFGNILEKSPTNIDARMGLIKAKLQLAKQREKQAIYLYREGLEQDNQNKNLIDLKKWFSWNQLNTYDYAVLVDKADQLTAAKKLEEAKQLYALLLKNNPGDLDVRLSLINVNYELGYDRTAFNLTNDGLSIYPDNIALLMKEAEIETTMKQYAIAQQTYQKVLKLDPEQKAAKDFSMSIDEISPRYAYGLNEIGIFTDNAWVQDLHEIWDYSTLFYARDTTTGRLVLKVNYASRTGIDAPQYEVDFSPRINRNVYIDLVAAVAKQPAIFPDYVLGGEVYWNFPGYVELSGGTKRSEIESTYFSTQTISVTRYDGQNMLTLRPFRFAPKGNKNISTLYTATFRHYFATNDNWLSVTAGTGHSPDLADLLTVDFLVITNNFITLNYEFPAINHRLVFDVGAGYQRWGYPSGLVRNLYDGSIGLKYRF